MIGARSSIGIVAGIIAGLCVWIMLGRANDEQAIRQRFADIVEAANRAPKVPVFEQIAIVRQAGTTLAPQTVGVLRSGASERQYRVTRREVEERALGALKSGWRDLEVGVSGISVRVDGSAAEAELEVRILGGLNGAEGMFHEHWGLKLALTKIDAEWLITRADGTNLRE